MITFLSQKSQEFECVNCEYKTANKKDYNKHLLTRKHFKKAKMITNDNILSQKSQDDYSCEKCGSTYKYRSGISRHKKYCNNKIICSETNNVIVDCDNNFLELIKQNQEFKELIVEQNKLIFELAKTPSNQMNITNTNCNNKSFNLQVFLNEKCKDALNINEFIDSLKITLSDLENFGESGFVDGISKIFINGLKSLDIYKRPIHCSDLKRETMHLKEENVWEKDTENKDRLKKVVRLIAHKNMMKVNDWKEAHPQYKDGESKKNDQYLKILIGSVGSLNKDDEEQNYEKIIKNVAKEVTIDKQR